MKTPRKFFLTMVCSFIFISLSAQQMNMSWIKSAGGFEWDMVTDMTIINDSIIVATGTFFNSISFGNDSLTSIGDQDIFVACFKNSGEYINAFSIGTKGYDYSYKVMADENNSTLFLALKVHNLLTINNTVIDSLGKSNFVIANLTQKGELLSYANFATNEISNFTDFCSATDGDLYFTGSFTGELKTRNETYFSNGEDIYFGKISKKGDLRWMKIWGNNGKDKTFNLAKGKNMIFLSGLTDNGCFDLDKLIVSTENKKSHFFIAQINNAGNVIEVNYPFSGSEFTGKGLVVTDTSVWATAMFKYNITTPNKIYNSRGKSDILLLNSPIKRLDFKLKHLGGKGFDIPIQIAVSGNSLVFSGMFSDSLKVNEFELFPISSKNDIFVSTISKNLEIDRVFTLNGDDYNFSSVLKVFKSGVYIAGEFNGKIGNNEKKVHSKGREDVFIARYENCDAKNPLSIRIDSVMYAKDKYAYDLDAGDGFVNYLWNNNSRDQIIKTKKEGLYYVEVEDEWGCFYVDSISINILKSNFFSDHSEIISGIKFYPTLTKGKVNVMTNNDIATTHFKLEILGIDGKILSSTSVEGIFKSDRIYQLDLTGYPPASYFIRIITDNDLITSKIILY